MTQIAVPYDLEERTARFGESVILFCKSLQSDAILSLLLNQIVRSSTSVGANYMEANGANSLKDFQNKIYICKKEVQETKHWLLMIAVHSDRRKAEIRLLWKEAHELTLIFNKISTSIKEKQLKIKSLKID